MIERIDSGAHVAVVDAIAGAGVLMSPNWKDDVYLPSLPVELPGGLIGYRSGSLLAESWDDMVGRLFRKGWALLDDDEGDPLLLATTTTGKTAYALTMETTDTGPVDIEFFAQEHAEWETHLRALLKGTGEDWAVSDDFGGDLD